MVVFNSCYSSSVNIFFDLSSCTNQSLLYLTINIYIYISYYIIYIYLRILTISLYALIFLIFFDKLLFTFFPFTLIVLALLAK